MAWRPFDLSGAAQAAVSPEAASSGDPAAGASAAAIIEAARRPQLACPRCQSASCYRNGQANGMQRFRCRECRRSFNALTGTPLARLRHKDKWLAFCACLLDAATTVRRAAGQTGVHRNTSFRWRHRMLALTKLDRSLPLSGTVEIQTVELAESHKGARPPRGASRYPGSPAARSSSGERICLLLARDRHGRTHDALTGQAPLTLAQLQGHLGGALHIDARMLTRHAEPYRQFAAAAGILHIVIERDARSPHDTALHLDNVSAYRDRLCTWLGHFRGVATRYLENYCGWRWAIDGPRLHTPEALLRCAVGCFLSQR